MKYPTLLERFIKYTKIDTQSSEENDSYPSTPKQLNLSNLLIEELKDLGMEDVSLIKEAYVLGTLKGNVPNTPTIALIAHVDTSPEVSGENVKVQLHKNYNAQDLELKEGVVLKVSENPCLKKKKGHTLITTSGDTLLGADDKAGITEIVTAIEFLINNPNIPRPNIKILFTPDEETGRGTENISIEDISADYGYTIDGGELGEIEEETFCADTVEIEIQGVNVHPGYAKNKMVNALKIASRIIDRLPLNTLSPETTERREGYIHPHSINGSSDNVELKFLIRDFTEKGLEEKEKFLETILSQIMSDYPTASSKFNVINSYRNMKEIIEKSPQVVEKAIKAIELAGIKPITREIRGGTDGAKLSFMGLPTPNIFTGGMNFHSIYEWITLEDMQAATDTIINLLKLWTEEKEEK